MGPAPAQPGMPAEPTAAFTYDPPLTLEGAEIDRLLAGMKARRRRLVVEMVRALAETGRKDAQAEPD